VAGFSQFSWLLMQKKEKRIFDMLPESEITFDDLAEWYKDLKQINPTTILKYIYY